MRVPVGVGERKRRAADVRHVAALGSLGPQRDDRLGHRGHIELGGDAEGQSMAQPVGAGVGVRIDQTGQQRRAATVDNLDTPGTRSTDRSYHLAGHVHVDLAKEPFAVEHLGTGDHELGQLVLLC